MDNFSMLLEPIRETLHQIGAFLPRLLLAIFVLVIGWLVAQAPCASRSSRRCARSTSTSSPRSAGIDHFLQQGGTDIDTIRVLGGLFYWLVILAALMIAFNSLDLAYVTDLHRPHRAVRAAGDGRPGDSRLRRVFRALRRRGTVRTYLRNVGRHRRRVAGPARAVRDHGVRHPDRARPDRSRRRHPADVPDHCRGSRASRWRSPSASAAKGAQPS